MCTLVTGRHWYMLYAHMCVVSAWICTWVCLTAGGVFVVWGVWYLCCVSCVHAHVQHKHMCIVTHVPMTRVLCNGCVWIVHICMSVYVCEAVMCVLHLCCVCICVCMVCIYACMECLFVLCVHASVCLYCVCICVGCVFVLCVAHEGERPLRLWC